jgi:hypothetical protein
MTIPGRSAFCNPATSFSFSGTLLRRMSPVVADSVAKVFLSHRPQIFRAVGAAIEY